MNKLKKYLDQFYWYDIPNSDYMKVHPETKYAPEYPSTHQMFFGTVANTFILVNDKVLPHNKSKSYIKYAIDQGFDLFELSCGSYKLIHHDKCIVIAGDILTGNEVSEDDDDEDDNNSPKGLSYNEDAIHFTTIPTVENRIFLEKFIKKINSFLIDVSTQDDKFYLIAQNQHGLFTQKTKFKSIPIKDERYDLFYGKKFPHDKMKKFIDSETENLMLLHGDPGTGKSNVIKHLITKSKKKVIYIAPSMLNVLSSPQFVPFMLKNQNSILLIEDAEEVLSVDRNSATNNLLGLTDGFLKDSLKLKIIATFNCDIGRIDPALMRKGRMYLEYKFDKLSISECKDLATYMELNRDITEPMTLAEFFNEEDNHVENNSFETRRIGFA